MTHFEQLLPGHDLRARHVLAAQAREHAEFWRAVLGAVNPGAWFLGPTPAWRLQNWTGEMLDIRGSRGVPEPTC